MTILIKNGRLIDPSQNMDAQKDILADTLGAILVTILFFCQHRIELARLNH